MSVDIFVFTFRQSGLFSDMRLILILMCIFFCLCKGQTFGKVTNNVMAIFKLNEVVPDVLDVAPFAVLKVSISNLDVTLKSSKYC